MCKVTDFCFNFTTQNTKVMMMKAIISLIGLISTINASQRLLKSLGCGANEEFTQCNGHCRPTCATGPNIICTLQCQPGCNCIDGYILDEVDGTCIPDNTCPGSTTCDGENEEYNFCGSACPAVCGVDGPDACITLCVEGCFCADGYIRDTNGDCISEDECNAGSDVCPLRCEGGFDGCNTCGCDRLGNPTFCTEIACLPDSIAPAECRGCEIGYTLNTVTNTCDSGE